MAATTSGAPEGPTSGTLLLQVHVRCANNGWDYTRRGDGRDAAIVRLGRPNIGHRAPRLQLTSWKHWMPLVATSPSNFECSLPTESLHYYERGHACLNGPKSINMSRQGSTFAPTTWELGDPAHGHVTASRYLRLANDR